VLGDDELSRVIRRIATPSDHQPANDKIAALLGALREWLMDKGWPDPMQHLVLRNGEFDGETLDSLRSYRTLLEISEGQAKVVPGWRTIQSRYEAGKEALHPDWGAAKIIELGLNALQTEGDLRDRALMEFGFYVRDWLFRRAHGPNAKIRLGQWRRFKATRDKTLPTRNAERRTAAHGWNEHARVIASEIWSRQAGRSVREVARQIRRKFEAAAKASASGAVLSADGEVPSEKTIARAIRALKPT
jgi:hypothetical protein